MSTESQLLPQFKLGARVGAAKELASQTMIYLSLPQSIVIWVMSYYQIPPVNATIPQWIWFAAVPLGFVLMMVGHYVFMHKAWVEFNSTQNADPEVNPHYRDMLDGFERIEERLDELEESR